MFIDKVEEKKKENKVVERVPSGYAVVVEGLTGKLSVKGPGIQVFFPWDKRTLVCTSSLAMDYTKEKYKSLEEYEIIVDTAISYKIVDPLKYHVEKEAIKQLNILMSSIMRRLISQQSYTTVADLKVVIDENNEKFGWIALELAEFESKYGIKVEKFIIQKAELTEDLKKSKEEDALVSAKNKRDISVAETEKTIAGIKAETSKIEEMTKVEIESQKIEQIMQKIGGLDSPEKLKLLRDILIGATAQYTIVESNSNNANIDTAMNCSAISNGINQGKNKSKTKK